MTYNVFISYSWNDPERDWVRRALFPALERAGLSVCIDKGEFGPGHQVKPQIAAKWSESEVMLGVITASYFAEETHTLYECRLAAQRDVSGSQGVFIPLRLDDTAIPQEFGNPVCIDWRSPSEREGQWELLLEALHAGNPKAPVPSPSVPAVAIPNSDPQPERSDPQRWRRWHTAVFVSVVVAYYVLAGLLLAEDNGNLPWLVLGLAAVTGGLLRMMTPLVPTMLFVAGIAVPVALNLALADPAWWDQSLKYVHDFGLWIAVSMTLGGAIVAWARGRYGLSARLPAFVLRWSPWRRAVREPHVVAGGLAEVLATVVSILALFRGSG